MTLTLTVALSLAAFMVGWYARSLWMLRDVERVARAMKTGISTAPESFDWKAYGTFRKRLARLSSRDRGRSGRPATPTTRSRGADR
jgi:hypothetical protein